ncbi:polysaccharide deacetylase family protein [Tahibacter caeni]|uniref:polysaccharide deacetylase family protein n=1 Tax=Tahibacter caeni TaxID=1453545 RepID=UPI0021475ED6|nr:polysaccharide deacetylase family protein [Tahibacter caeni]
MRRRRCGVSGSRTIALPSPSAVLPAVSSPPRHPQAWAWLFALSQIGGGAVGLQFGWDWGVPLILGAQALSFWATLWPQSRLLSPVLVRLPARERLVWLTIDDGPSDDTPALLDLLDRHDAKACFFLVGERAEARPELVREIARRGHEIGNHSYSHPEKWFWALPPRAMRAQIDHAQQVLGALAGRPPRWFRAVVGMANPFVAAALKPLNLTRVAWSARGFDAREADPACVVARIARGLRPGAIVLLHEGAPHGNSVAIVAAVLQRLGRDGYRCVLPLDDAAADPQPAPTAAVRGGAPAAS